MKRFLSVLAAGVAFAAASSASATNVVVSKLYDLTGATITGSSVTATVSESTNLNPQVLISNGDTVDVLINFYAGQSITLTGPIKLNEFLSTAGSKTANQSGTLTLISSAGNYSISSGNFTSSTIGYTFPPNSLLNAPDITFTGIEWKSTANSTITFNNAASQYYNSVGFSVTGDTATVSGVSNVPEPASWALMLGGFGALGFVLRRGRREHLATI